jgi:hypothetical protein
MALSDQQVADFLLEFRDRPDEVQQSSPVWQELIQFSGWGMASFKPKKNIPREATEALPDPRLPAHERAAILKAQGGVTDDAKGKKPSSGAMTTKSTQGAPNPWAQYPTPGPGPVFVALNTDLAPPYPGNWRRTPDGWYRNA